MKHLFVAKYIALGKEWGTEYLKSETLNEAMEEIMELNETVTPEYAACGEFILHMNTHAGVKLITKKTKVWKTAVYGWFGIFDGDVVPDYIPVDALLLDIFDLYKIF